MGKLQVQYPAQTGELETHSADTVRHITAAERSNWNSKAAGSHTHSLSSIGAAPSSHTHTISQITNISSVIPKGVITMWSGSASTIPSGWTLCNGSNGAPDLRDRFIVGAGASYTAGSTGGEATHKLTIAEMPSHAPVVYAYKPNWGSRTGGLDARWVDLLTDAAPIPTSTIGNDQPHNNLPPYYALCFIMKL